MQTQALVLAIYGARLSAMLLFRDVFIQHFKDMRERIEGKAPSNRLMRLPFIGMCGLLYACMACPLVLTARHAHKLVPGSLAFDVADKLVWGMVGAAALSAAGDAQKTVAKHFAPPGKDVLVDWGVFYFFRHPNYTGEQVMWSCSAALGITAALAGGARPSVALARGFGAWGGGHRCSAFPGHQQARGQAGNQVRQHGLVPAVGEARLGGLPEPQKGRHVRQPGHVGRGPPPLRGDRAVPRGGRRGGNCLRKTMKPINARIGAVLLVISTPGVCVVNQKIFALPWMPPAGKARSSCSSSAVYGAGAYGVHGDIARVLRVPLRCARLSSYFRCILFWCFSWVLHQPLPL
mmetsp:Transcript_19779/g.39230  ORF Transcript_19779/g.39230 Transcript_19779/m.39230 type:complete len:348 (+) Transcript_19779:178-1221(+)